MPKTADTLGPSPYSGEQGEIKEINRPYDQGDWNPAQDLKLVYVLGQVHISGHEDYDELARNAGAPLDYEGPMIVGKVHIDMGKASFEIASNIHSEGIKRVLLSLCQKQGWQFGGLTDLQGQPLSESHVSSIYFQAEGSNLKFAHKSSSLKPDGAIHIAGKNAHVYPIRPQWMPALSEWAKDEGMILYAGDNVIKKIEDIEQEDLYTPEWNNPEDHFLGTDPKQNDLTVKGPFQCRKCQSVFPTMNALIEHQQNDEEQWTDRDDPSKMRPLPNMDDQLPAKFFEQQKYYGKLGANPPLPGPMPFIYDVKHDTIELGNPGITPDSMGAGKFTPQIIRGTYEAGGKLILQSMSDYSVTVGHILDLWAYSPQTHPFYIKSVWLDDGTGSPQKLQ